MDISTIGYVVFMYCQTVKGIKTCSNIPVSEWNTPQPHNSHYDIYVKLAIPIAPIMADIESAISFVPFARQLEVSGYPNAKNIRDYKISAPNWNTIHISYIADSPWVYIIIAVIAVIVVWEIDQITVNISHAPVSFDILGIVALGGLAIVGAMYYTHKGGKLPDISGVSTKIKGHINNIKNKIGGK